MRLLTYISEIRLELEAYVAALGRWIPALQRAIATGGADTSVLDFELDLRDSYEDLVVATTILCGL